MIQVYISSTYEDLKEYRAAVDDVLRDLRFHVVSMEHYTASDQRPLDECLADVAACDLYLGLYAWRYGYVPEDPNKNPDQESITVLE